MVLQRTIENLRERSKEERRNIAFLITIAVVTVLFFGWLVFFFQSAAVTLEVAPDAYNAAVGSVQEVVDKTGWVSQRSEKSGDIYVAPEIQATEVDNEDSVEFIEEAPITSQ